MLKKRGNAEMLLTFTSRYRSSDRYLIFALSLFMYIYIYLNIYFYIFMYMYNKHCLRVTGHLQSNILLTYLCIYKVKQSRWMPGGSQRVLGI